MSIRENFRAILADLSSILAGFKLAVIVTGYFGVGSVAKWIISYWYPFTRWLWDALAELLSLPTFPVLVKDSLTALVFFLPLGITAIWQKANGDTESNDPHRVMGAVFGMLFLIVICKDVLTSIFWSLSTSLQSISSTLPLRNYEVIFPYIVVFYSFVTVVLAALIAKARKSSPEGSSFFSHLNKFEKRARKEIFKNRRRLLRVNLLLTGLFLFSFGGVLIWKLGADTAIPVSIAMSILGLIMIILLLAILYAPKKLYITMGAAIAFMAAAIFFEAFIEIKLFMESVSAS